MAVEPSSGSESDNQVTPNGTTPCEPNDNDDLRESAEEEPIRQSTLPSSHSILQLLSNPNKKRRGKDLRPRKRRSYKELSQEQIQSFRCSYPNCDRKYVGQYGRFNLQRHIKAKHADQPEIPIQAMIEPVRTKGSFHLEPPSNMFGAGLGSYALGLNLASRPLSSANETARFDRFRFSPGAEFGGHCLLTAPQFRLPGRNPDLDFDFLPKPVLPPPGVSKLDTVLPHIDDRELSSPNTGRLKPIDSILAGGVQDFKPSFHSRDRDVMQPSPNFSLACK
jgi:hypothetical protein